MIIQGCVPLLTWQHSVDLATILGAVASAAAVIWAVLSTLHERRERKAAQNALQKERGESREAAKRDQAQHLVGWFEHVVTDHIEEPDDDLVMWEIPVEWQPTMYVGNHSGAPVFDVQVTIIRIRDDRRVGTWRRKVLAPGSTWKELRPDDADIHQQDVRVEVVFRDVAGRRWTRHDDGRLEELLTS